MHNSFKKSIVAGALALTILAGSPVAHGQSSSATDLQAQIAQLLAQINQLQSQLNGGASSFGQYTWTRSLSVGSTGSDVLKLQQFLNQSADTRVAQSGIGSLGFETSYFGPATAAAVSKFQVKYRSEILTPNGLVNPTGFFGPTSIAKANALTRTTLPSPNPTTPTNPTTPNEEVGTILQGEGVLTQFEIEEASPSEVKEASSDIAVAELLFEASDGDIEISRLDLALVADVSNDERDPWDTFESISLWVDGDKIAEQRIDERSKYLNRNLGTIRFSNLDLVLEEDEELEMTVAVSVKNNIKGAGTAADWNVSVERLRYFDGDGVANDDSTTGDLKDSVSFEIVERGDGEELKFSLGNNNPDTKNIIVDESKRTNNVTILEYTLEAIDADIELDTLYVNVETGSAALSDVVHDIKLQIGGKTYRKDTILTTGLYSATSTRVAFDIDGGITIDMDDKETVKVIVDLKPRTAYTNGETIIARVTSVERDTTKAEGNDDIKVFSGTVIGKQHSLLSEGIAVPVDDVRFKTTTLGQNDTTGVFTIEFEVTAVEGDYFITENASTTMSTSTGGVTFAVDTAAGEPTSISGSLTSTAREDSSGVFTIREGQTETFTLSVMVDASVAGSHRVALQGIYFSAETDGVTNGEQYETLPVNKFRTGYSFINN